MHKFLGIHKALLPKKGKLENNTTKCKENL